MTGIGFTQSLIETQTHQDMEQQVEQVAEEFNLEIEEELDEVGVKYLGGYTNARTSKTGAKTRIDFDSQSFFDKTEKRQKRIILHELIHVKQFENQLSDWAEKEFGVSEKFSDELEDTIWQDVRDIEGETEILLSTLFPEEQSSYPYHKQAKQRELESKGIDVEEEMQHEENSLYREVDSIEIGENIYREEGVLNNEEYTVAVIGDKAAEKGPAEVENYLEETINDYMTEEHPVQERIEQTDYSQEGYAAST